MKIHKFSGDRLRLRHKGFTLVKTYRLHLKKCSDMQLWDTLLGGWKKLDVSCFRMCSHSSLFDELASTKKGCCGTVHSNNKGMPYKFGHKTQKQIWGDIQTRIRRNLIAMAWKGKRGVYTLTCINHQKMETSRMNLATSPS